MILEITIVDFIAVLYEETSFLHQNTDRKVEITYKRINFFRESLRKRNILNDLGYSDWKTMGMIFPENILLQEHGIKIIASPTFERLLQVRLSRYVSSDKSELLQILKESI